MPDENVASPQPSPTPTPKVINWKTILIRVVIGAVLLGGGGYLVYNAYQPKKEEPAQTTTTTKTATPSATTQTSKDETADWKTYTGSQISFKYPPSWKEYDTSTDANSTRPTPSFSDKDPNTVSPGVVVPTISIDKSSTLSVFGTDFNGLVNTSVGYTWNAGKSYKKIKNLTVGSMQAVWIRQSLEAGVAVSGPSYDHIYIEKSNKVYDFYLMADTASTLDQYSTTFNLIITTFKFL